MQIIMSLTNDVLRYFKIGTVKWEEWDSQNKHQDSYNEHIHDKCKMFDEI